MTDSPIQVPKNEVQGSSRKTARRLRSSAAERMRSYRASKRLGLRTVSVVVHDSEVDGLIRIGLLAPELRKDRGAIAVALLHLLESHLA